jgi:hypothetical protein
MQFKTIDGSYKWPEVVALRATLTYSQYVSCRNEYSVIEHERKDATIELWLVGKLLIYQSDEEMNAHMKEEKQKDSYVR